MARDILQKAAEALEIPSEVAFAAPKLILTNMEELRAINHRGIVVYEQERVIFRTSGGLVEISGEKMHLEQLTREYLLIRGSIQRVEQK